MSTEPASAERALNSLKLMWTATKMQPGSEMSRDLAAFIYAAAGWLPGSDPDWDNIDMEEVRDRLRSPEGQAMMNSIEAAAREVMREVHD